MSGPDAEGGGAVATRGLSELVEAAGVICWRPMPGGGLEVLLVRSERWGDWSWPKGKRQLGEALPVCAVREVAEETGVSARLGRTLPTVSYRLPDGRPKRVSYWSGRAVEESPRTAGPEEIAEQAWLPLYQARLRLTRPGDAAPLHRLVQLAARNRLDTRALLIIRHGKAEARGTWHGPDDERPLTDVGRRQAEELVPLLGCWQPDHVLTSPWRRCLETVLPYSVATGTEVDQVPELTESAAETDPDAAVRTVKELLTELRGGVAAAAACTHRPVLQSVLAVLRSVAGKHARRQLPDRDPYLRPAEVLVAHVGREVTGPAIQAVERHRTG